MIIKRSKSDIQFRNDVIHSAEEVGISITARTFGINRKTIYRWLQRYEKEGLEGLTNRSRPNFKHPNKMPIEIEKKILAFKRQNPHISAQKIITELKLDYSLPTVLKKLRNAGLLDSSSSVRIDFLKRDKYKPFELIFFSVNKIEINGYKNKPVYCYTAHDFKTGYIFHSFAQEINQLVFDNFTIYIYDKLSHLGIPINECTAIPLRRKLLSFWLPKKNKSESCNPINKFKIKFLQPDQMSSENKLILRNIKSMFSEVEATNKLQTLLNSTIAFALANTQCFQTNPQLAKSVLKIYPIYLDNYKRLDQSKSTDMRIKNEDVFSDKLIDYLTDTASKYVDDCSFQIAHKFTDLLLELLKLYSDKKVKISQALILKAEVTKNLFTIGEAEQYYLQALHAAKESTSTQAVIDSKLKLASFHQDLNQYSIAEEHFLLALKLADNVNIKKDIAVITRLLAMNYLLMGQKEKGFKILKENWRVMRHIDDPELYVEYLVSFAIFHQKSGNHQIAEEYLKKAELKLSSVSDLHFHSMVYFNQISHYNLRKNVDLTKQYIAKMHEIIPSLYRIPKLLKANNIIGCALLEMEVFDEALKYFLKELQLAEKNSLSVSIMTAHINIAGFYYYQKKYSLAITHTQQSLEIAQKLNLRKGILISAINLVELFFMQNRVKTAYKILNEYLSLAEKYNSTSILYQFYSSFIKFHLLKHNREEALQFSKKALLAAKLLKNSQYITNEFYNIGTINISMKNYRTAIINLNKAERVAEANKFIDLLAEIKTSKAEYFIAVKKKAEANRFLKEAATLAKKSGDQELNSRISIISNHFREMKSKSRRPAIMIRSKRSPSRGNF